MTSITNPSAASPSPVPAEDKLRVLVVDDSLIYRKVVRDALATLPHVEVVGSAANGRVAIEKIEQFSPDMVTLDFEMPELDGLGVLKWLRQSQRPTKAVMLSALTIEGGEATVQALHEGAFDFVVKPSGKDAKQNQRDLESALLQQVDALHTLITGKRRRSTAVRNVPAAPPATPPSSSSVATNRPAAGTHRIGVVAIGVSTGGPDALRTMLPMLPGDFPVPIVIVQHMPPVFTKSLAESLNKICSLEVSEAVEYQIVKPGHVAIAPGGKQLKLLKTSTGLPQVKLTDDPPVQSCRPSVDYMLFSLAESFGDQTLSVIMTGMGYDGAEGSRRLHALGGPVIAQNEATCVVYGMPRKPIEEGYADVVAPLKSIAAEISRYAGRAARG
ncbi:MAG TPA: chemotaxis response regulator protein-glutamate methylesterase [Planctomycetaceae bacterium]|nr:chemotaxis response regulator protein-glutamate methylesterase [Planctomycetaceae bacterium]